MSLSSMGRLAWSWVLGFTLGYIGRGACCFVYRLLLLALG